MRVKARVVDQRRGAAQPRRDEYIASRLRPAAGCGAPDEVALLCPEPVLGLEALAGDVALAVEDTLGLAGRPAGERDQARVLWREVRRRRRLGFLDAPQHLALRSGGLDLAIRVGPQNVDRLCHCACSILHIRKLALGRGKARIHQKPDCTRIRHHVAQQTKPFGLQLIGQE